ncbi:MAG: PAS domain-containing protein [Fulvivirga sp.]
MSPNSDLSVIANLPLELEEFANIGVWHYNLLTGEITWSTGLYHIYELNEDDFDGTFENYRQYIYPEDVDLVQRQISEAIESKSTFSFTKRIITGKDNKKTLKTWGTIALDESGEVERLSGFSSDITESVNAERALIESNEFNKKLVDNTANAILIQDYDGNILYANETSAKLIKAPSVHALIGLNTSHFHDSKKEALIKGRLEQIKLTGKPAPVMEQEFTCFDGSKMVGESTVIPYEYKGRDAVLIIVNDITHQKRTLQALENSEEQIRFFVNNMPVSVAMFDKEMNYIACSEKYISDWWVQDQEMTPDKIVGLNHYEIFPDVKDEWRKIHSIALAGETLSREDDSFVKANGKKEWLRWKNTPWKNAHGEIGGIILFTEFITARKEAEEAIANSRNRLNTLIQNLPGMVYSCGPPPDYSMRFVSSGSEEITGYTPDAFFGEGKIYFEKVVHPEDLLKSRAAVKKAIDTNEQFDINYRIFTKSGELKHLHERGQALYNEEGELLSIEGVVTDISDVMIAQQALKQSKESLDAAQRVSHLGSWEFHLESGEVIWSDEYYRICGEKPGAFTPTFEIGASFIHPEDIEKTQKAIQETIETGIPYKLNKRIVRRDRTIRYVESQGELVKNEVGQPVKVIGSMQDITDRKITEDQLQESRLRNQALVNALPDLLFITTTDGKFLDAQFSDPSQLILPKDDFIGKNINEIFDQEISESYVEKSRQAERTKQPQTLEYSVTIKEELKYYEARIVKYAKGKVLSVVRDITKSKIDEKNLIKTTEELTNTNAELKQFAYITSHDLRAPVVNLDTLLQIYKSEEFTEEEKDEVLGKITSSIDQLKSTLNDLIQLVAVKDETKSELVEVKFEEIVNAITNSLETQISDARATIKKDFSEVPSVISKKTTVYSIIQNLISNAIKYKSDKPLEIIIKSINTEDGYTCLSVIDNGIGIDLKRHGDKLFGMYQRFHENKEGKGLGLYIIKSQIEALGGYIEVQSEIGEGTTFNVCFKH